MMLMLSFLLPNRLDVSVDVTYTHSHVVHTFYRVRLHQLGAVDEQGFWYGVPCHALGHSNVDVC